MYSRFWMITVIVLTLVIIVGAIALIALPA